MSEATYLVFDTETTGIDVFNDRIVQLVIATADANGELIEKWEWIINPGVEVPEGAAAVHGLTTAILEERGQNPRDALRDAYQVFIQHNRLTWVAFNLNFDATILDAEFRRHQVTDLFADDVLSKTCFDPLVVDRAKDKYRKGRRNLENMAPVYRVGFNADLAHEAGYDVEVTARVAAKVAERYGVPSTAEQSAWYDSWAAGLEQYLRRTNPDATVDRGWPLRDEED